MDFAIYQVEVDPDAPYGGKIVMVSPSMKDILGIEDIWRFENWFAHLHPEDKARVIEANRRAWQQRTRYDEAARFFNAAKGQWVWVHTISTPVVNPEGKLSHFTGVVLDITSQKQTEIELQKARDELEQRVAERTRELEQANTALRKEVEQRERAEKAERISQAFYLEVFDHSPLTFFIIEVLPDGRFRVLRTNPAHQQSSGLPPEKIWGKLVEDLLPPEVAQNVIQHYRDCITARAPMEYEEQGPAPYRDVERIRTFRTTLTPVFDERGSVVRLIGSSQDITEQKQAEQTVVDRAREEAAAAERSRLARELHDAVTQTLFSTTIIAEVLPKIWERSPAEGRQKIEVIRELTRGALAEMRTLLMELRPDAIAEVDLKDLLKHLTNAFIARARIPCRVEMVGIPEFSLDVKTVFYQIAQEALNNVAKHSEANQVNVILSGSSQQVTLRVTDDGQGFDVDQAAQAGHYGLRIMRERAEQVGATLEISSQPGQGTEVCLCWPVASKQPSL